MIYLYVCYPPGLEDYSSRPGIVSRSLSRGGFLSLSSKHGFFFAREKSSSTPEVTRTARVSGGSCVESATDDPRWRFFVQILVCVSKERDDLSSLSFFLLFWRKSRLMTTTLFFGGDYVLTYRSKSL